MATAATSSRSAWYGPMPFGGKPPPMPAGWNQNSLATNWNKGFWQPNPYYNPNVPAQQGWMPAQAWQQQFAGQNAGQNFNPYKRVVKPPSAEYLASALSENPLGLTNMTPREEFYGKENDNGAAHTPWFWNPTRLEDDDEQEAIITAVYRDQAGNKIGRESRGPAPTRHSSLDRRDSPVDNRPRSSSQATRQHSEPSIQRSSASAQANNYPARHSSEPPPESSRKLSFSDRSTSSHRRDASQERSRPSTATQHGPTPTPPDSASSTTSFNRPRNHEDFTSQIPLRTTFSTAIIRTPEHYTHSPRRSNSTSSTTSTTTTTTTTSPTSTVASGATSRTSVSPVQTHFSSASSSMDSLSQRLNQLSAGEVARASEVSATIVNGPSGTGVFTDEPSQMLSPLMMNTPKPLPNRPLGRHHTAPTPLDSIPETSPIPPAQPPPQSTAASRHVSPHSSRHVSPRASLAHEAHVSPPNSASVTWHPQEPQRTPPDSASSTRQFHDQRVSPGNRQQYQQQTPPQVMSSASASANARQQQQQQQQQHQHQHQHQQHQEQPHNISPRKYGQQENVAQVHFSSPPNSAPVTSGGGGWTTRHSAGTSSRSGPSTPATSSSTPNKTPPRQQRRRRGFWNRRGDHLTNTGKVVYAPPDRAYPEELRGYPGDKEGYMDEFGIVMGYLESRAELEESLPRHGRPPMRPYESFIVYE